MKQRALPQSFWQQPNVANPQPPGIICSALPPLPLGGESSAAGGGEGMTPVIEITTAPMQLFTPNCAAAVSAVRCLLFFFSS